MTTAIRPTELKTNTKQICDRAYRGETLIISRPHNENVVIISEELFQELEMLRKNTEYLHKLYRGNEDIKKNNLIPKSLEELEELINK